MQTTTHSDLTAVRIGATLIGDVDCDTPGAFGTDTPAPLPCGDVNTA